MGIATAGLIVTALALGACSSESDPDANADQDPSGEAVLVMGTGSCTRKSADSENVDGSIRIVETFVCELLMSDPRVSGTERFRVVSRESADGGLWTAKDVALETPGGSWTGSARGAFTFAGILPEAEDAEPPFNFGEAVYIGEGD